jgi:hypothetical protein
MGEKDHDLLIRVHETVQNLSNVMSSKFTDHESRIRAAEKDLDSAKGAIALMRIAIGILTGVAAVIGALWWLHP